MNAEFAERLKRLGLTENDLVCPDGEKVVDITDDDCEEIIVQEDDNEDVLSVFVRNNGFAGWTLKFNGDEYEFCRSFRKNNP